jgi:3-methyladenine DNA glycosylase Tag
MKNPEELADEHSRKFFSWDNKTAAASSFLAGYQAGIRQGTIDTKRHILNEYFDRYGAEEHAKFALAVNAYELEDDNENT